MITIMELACFPCPVAVHVSTDNFGVFLVSPLEFYGVVHQYFSFSAKNHKECKFCVKIHTNIINKWAV